MAYAELLKDLFPGLALDAEDLLFLEPFQISYLTDRVPKREFAVLLDAHPVIRRYLIANCPSLSSFVEDIMKETAPGNSDKTVDEACSDLLWEIADLIVYAKYPELYDEKVACFWQIEDLFTPQSLEGKTAVDAGAGPGKLAFQLARYAHTVFAVEPVRAFRQFIRDKAQDESLNNLFPVDGFLDALPFPDRSIDVVMTSNAIGWHLEDELQEIERVLVPKGTAVHLFHIPEGQEVEHLHEVLTSSRWNYTCTSYPYTEGSLVKYSKETGC